MSRIFAFCASLLPFKASALPDCSAAADLARFYNHYVAILSEDSANRTTSAARLYPLAASLDGEALAHLLYDVDDDRLQKVLDAGEKLALDIITGQRTPDLALAPHSYNLAWLGRIVLDSGCLSTGGGASSPGSGETRSVATPRVSIVKDTADFMESAILPAILAGLGLIGLVVLGILANFSRRLRIHSLRRLPRQNVALEFDVAFKAPDGSPARSSVEAQDISAGGMKIAWRSPPPNGTPITLLLPAREIDASIVWVNAFFAGIMFDKNLDPAELKSITEAK